MKMFIWRSDTLRQYGAGWFIAQATTADAARKKLRAQFKVWLATDRDWEDADGVAALQLKFDRDLAKDPVTQDVLFIYGSD